eukprot:5676090-Amphidinium_carterae.2
MIGTVMYKYSYRPSFPSQLLQTDSKHRRRAQPRSFLIAAMQENASCNHINMSSVYKEVRGRLTDFKPF